MVVSSKNCSNQNFNTKKKKSDNAFILVVPCPITNVFQKRPMVLPARHRVYCGPAVFTVVLQTSHTATEERSRLSIALDAMTLITDLVV